jgi:hypothetical protein
MMYSEGGKQKKCIENLEIQQVILEIHRRLS